MLQNLGPALDQVKAWQQAVDHVISELLQIGPLLPQLKAQIIDSARQILEFSQQQQRFEVDLLDMHSDLQRLKSFWCCTADYWVFYEEACSGSAPPSDGCRMCRHGEHLFPPDSRSIWRNETGKTRM